jgi:hypothetical protein
VRIQSEIISMKIPKHQTSKRQGGSKGEIPNGKLADGIFLEFWRFGVLGFRQTNGAHFERDLE